MPPIRKGDGTPLVPKGISQVRTGDGRILFDGVAIPDSAVLQFDGTDDYVDFDRISISGEYTVTVWAWADSYSSNLQSMIGDDDRQVQFSVDEDDQYGYRFGDGDDFYREEVDLKPSGEWHHFAWTRNSDDKIDLSINAGDKTRIANNDPQTGDLIYDTIGTADDQYWVGMLFDVRIFDSELDTDDIEAVKDGDSGASDPLYHWPLNEGEGDTAEDIASGNDGTIVGAEWVEPDPRPRD